MSGVFEKFQREHDEKIIQRIFDAIELIRNGTTVLENAKITGFSIQQIEEIAKHI